MNRICPRCKSKNRDAGKFCHRCGAPLGAAQPAAQKCPSGHVLDPGWDDCPYCESEKANKGETTHRSRQPTIAENEAIPPRPQKSSPRPASGPAHRGETVEKDTRRIVGVLVTWSRQAEGEIFPVREGRNRLGRDPSCEIRVTGDARVSASHSFILHREDGSFWIADDSSAHGTFLNGEVVEERRRLPGSAVIRTGDTLWRFSALEPPAES